MNEFLIVSSLGVVLLLLTSAVVYEALAVIWRYLPSMPIGRLRVAIVMASIFACHIVCIWIYGLAFWLLQHHSNLGRLVGESVNKGIYGTDLFSMVYYSTITYTSLGFGDIVPTGGFRLLSGIEVLNGLVLIGWTVSFAFLAMQRYWKFRDYE